MAYILGLEGAHKHFIVSAKKHLLKGLVSIVLLFAQFVGISEGLAFVGDDGGSGAGSDDCGGARVYRRDESGGGEVVLDIWGDRKK